MGKSDKVGRPPEPTVGRKVLLRGGSLFNELNLTNLTSAMPGNIDHMIISQKIAKGKSIRVSQFNREKLSDHTVNFAPINLRDFGF
jgi:hypothetical protein